LNRLNCYELDKKLGVTVDSWVLNEEGMRIDRFEDLVSSRNMAKYIVITSGFTILGVFFLFWGCGGPPEPPPEPRVVVKKIIIEKESRPQTKKTLKIATPAPKIKKQVPAPKPVKLKTKKDLKTGRPRKPWMASLPGKLQQIMGPVPGKTPKKKSSDIVDGYDPRGKIDPFEPIFKKKTKTKPRVTETKKGEKTRKKRVPLTPLERMDLSQLKLVGVIQAPSGNRALIEESSGKGYIIKKGTYIGINEGVVSKIFKDRIIVRETVENYYGEVSVRNRELRIQKPPGEL